MVGPQRFVGVGGGESSDGAEILVIVSLTLSISLIELRYTIDPHRHTRNMYVSTHVDVCFCSMRCRRASNALFCAYTCIHRYMPTYLHTYMILHAYMPTYLRTYIPAYIHYYMRRAQYIDAYTLCRNCCSVAYVHIKGCPYTCFVLMKPGMSVEETG